MFNKKILSLLERVVHIMENLLTLSSTTPVWKSSYGTVFMPDKHTLSLITAVVKDKNYEVYLCLHYAICMMLSARKHTSVL